MVGELQTALNSLQKYFPEGAKFLLGACVAPFCSDEIQVTGVICQKQETSISTSISELGGWQPEKTDSASRKIAEQGKNTGAQPIQAELPLQEQALGIFSGIKPTTLKGENLDIPTFQRRGINIDAGD